MICSRSLNYRASLVLGIDVTNPRQVIRILHRIQSLVNVIMVRYIGQEEQPWATDPDEVMVHCPAELLQNGLCSLSIPQTAK